MEKYLPIIKNSPLFHGMAEDDILMMLNCLNAKIVSYDKGDFIFYVGDTMSSLGMVLSGNVHIIEEDYLGNRNILSSVTAPQLFGEVYACNPAMKLKVNVVAVEKTYVLFMNVQKVTTVCTTACKFHTKLIQNRCSACKNADELLTKIQHCSKRTTRQSCFHTSVSRRDRNEQQLSIPFNRQELADYLSVDRSAMSNELCKCVMKA